MNVPKYKWPKEVKKLWDNKCAYCGRDEKEWYIEAHHIEPKSIHPELATALENGIALCRRCHRSAHNGDFTKTATIEEYRKSPYYKHNADVIEFVDSQTFLVLTTEEAQRLNAAAEAEGISVNRLVLESINAQHPGTVTVAD